MKTMWGLAFWFIGVSAGAQPLPQSIDQTRYFATPEIERSELEQCIGEVADFPAAAPANPLALGDYLQRAERLLARLQRHAAYLWLRASRDIDDQADSDAANRADDTATRLLADVEAALRALGSDAFAKDVRDSPSLNRYAYLLVQAERELGHELPADQQHILDEVADPAGSNLWTLYQQTVRSTPFAKIDAAGGPLDAKKDAALLAENPDRAVRQAAWQGRWEGYASRSDIYATILLGVVRLNDRVARLRHFPDAPSAVYFKRNLDRKSVSEALDALENHVNLFKMYQRLRAERAAAMNGIADVRSWDLLLPTPGFVTPRMSLDETHAAALAALAPLGEDYVEHFRQLLDPANRRLDIAAERGKRTNGGFSVDAPGVATGLFVESYQRGLLGESRVIIHEGGHAIHNQLMYDSGVSPFYTRGPNWMFEAFATLNEFLLYDHLYRSSTDLKARAYYLQALIDDINFSLFGSAEEGTLEQSIYDGVIAGHIKNAADLDALTLSIWNKFEIWPALEPQLAHTWAAKSLMFQDPLYLVNYLYAGLLATKMLDMIEHDPAGFKKRYADLLRNGFYAPPQQLLRTFFGRDLSQRDLVEDDMNILAQRIRALGDTYKKMGAAPR
ncbi:MAG TPA: M3 family metallopeptidase [Steroidobacteraceae bacterium]|nr:M3 family metallopeptidase [Steroidobacteraceae bacterium]